MNRAVLMHMVPRGLVVAVMLVFVLKHTPYVKDVRVTGIRRHGGAWIVEGMITIDPTRVPLELQYNYDDSGFLLWWEDHINDVLAEHGIKQVHVQTLELTWVETGDVDVIGVYIELVLGQARTPFTYSTHRNV